MQVRKTPGTPKANLETRAPIHDGHVGIVQIIFKSPVRHEIIDEQPLAVSNAVAHERNQMPVVHTADDLDLRSKLTIALSAAHSELLHSHERPVGQRALVNAPKPTLP